jgi:hypothetical protein
VPSRGLQWQAVQIPLAAGLDTGRDVRAGNPPGLDIARDVEFDEENGLQSRRPFVDIGSTAIVGGGSLTNLRRVERNGDELLVFTDTQLYSWSPQQAKWSPRATYLAVASDERGVFVGTGDQIDTDRAELGGLIVYTWAEGGAVFAGAIDKATGAAVVTPTQVSTAIGRPRVVALATRILLFVQATSSTLTVRVIDPASPAAGIGGAGTTVSSAFNSFYDVVKVDGQDRAIGVLRLSPTTSYLAFAVTAAGAVSTSSKARAADGPLAVTTTIGGGTAALVVRANGTAIVGDLLTTSTLADNIVAATLGTAAGTPVNQVTAAFADATTATAYWVSGETSDQTAGPVSLVRRNTITTSAVPGSQVDVIQTLGIASRAFAYAGRSYVWLVFALQNQASTIAGPSPPLGTRVVLQNTYYLYRDDGLLVARAADEVAGGFAPSTGRLPGVAPSSSSGTEFSWCGTARRVIEAGGNERSAYDARSPRDITFTFDSNAARRCARIGKTLYVTGSIPMQYDGAALVEVGFLVYPLSLQGINTATAGVLSAGAYTYKSTLRWQNAQGEQERSTTAVGMDLTTGASTKNQIFTYALTVTLKTAARTPPAIELWRTQVNPTPDSDSYLITSKDPTVLSGDNRYIANDPTQNLLPAAGTLDNIADSVLLAREANPENGDVLEFIAPPGAAIMVATDTRVFLGAVAGDPDRVWYSRLRGINEIVSFNEALTVDVPAPGGAITAIAVVSDALIVFRATAVYALPGSGLTNTLGGQNYGPPRIISQDIGAVNHEAVALTPAGVMFKSRKGWFLLTPDLGLKYIGGKVLAFDDEVILGIDVVETQHHVRVLSAARMLTWDYLVGEWSEWTVTDGLHSTVWQGRHVYLAAAGVRVQSDSFAGVTYGTDVELAWVKPSDLQGSQAVRRIMALGETRGAHLVRVRVARDYQYLSPGNPDYFDDEIWTQSPNLLGSALQVEHSPSQQDLEAIKVRLTAVTAGTSATLSTLTLDPVQVPTLTTPWAAVLTALAPGAYGNRFALAVAMEYVAGPFVIDVRDHFVWSTPLGRWREAVNTIGVRIAATEVAPPTIGQLQAAIAAATKLATITTPDTASKVLSPLSSNWSQSTAAPFTSGAYGVPTGESMKLTGLAFEVGAKPGLYRRLPPAQKV